VHIPLKVTAYSGDRDRLGNRGGAGGVNFARSVTISQIERADRASERRRSDVFFLKKSAAVAPQAFSAGSGGGAAQCG
jgi:hypothetical protein